MLYTWIQKWMNGTSGHKSRPSVRKPGGFKPTLEGLEAREVLSTARALPVVAATPTALVAKQLTSPPVVALSPTAVAATGQTPVPRRYVTANSLNWTNYQVVEGGMPYHAGTQVAFYLEDTNPMSAAPKRVSGDPDWNPTLKKWKTTLTVNKTDINVIAWFDAAKSWVTKGHQTATLLEHERLHFRIGEEIAYRFAWHFKNLKGKGTYTHSNKTTSLNEAKKLADKDLYRRIIALKAQMVSMYKDLTNRYDLETNHAANRAGQLDWDLNWLKKIDEKMKTVKS